MQVCCRAAYALTSVVFGRFRRLRSSGELQCGICRTPAHDNARRVSVRRTPEGVMDVRCNSRKNVEAAVTAERSAARSSVAPNYIAHPAVAERIACLHQLILQLLPHVLRPVSAALKCCIAATSGRTPVVLDLMEPSCNVVIESL